MDSHLDEKAVRARKMRDWYVRNRESYNAIRRERYRAGPPGVVKGRPKRTYSSETVVREINGKTTTGHSTGYVAQLIQRTPQMLRTWERLGLIPAHVFPDKHRYYSPKQVDAIQTLVKANEALKQKNITLSDFMLIRDQVHQCWASEWQ